MTNKRVGEIINYVNIKRRLVGTYLRDKILQKYVCNLLYLITY